MRRVPSLLCLLGVLLLGAIAQATTYRELSLAEMLDAAEIAFSGTVVAAQPEMRGGEPWTLVTFSVERGLLGASAGDRVTLAFLGGERTGGAATTVSLMPRFETGEEVLLLAYDEEYYSPLVGFNQGLWRLREGGYRSEAGAPLALDGEGRPVLEGEAAAAADAVDALARELEARR